MNKLLIIGLFLVLPVWISGQESILLDGKVSYVSSRNIYARFVSTHGISEGDTIYRLENGTRIPLMVVSNLSSTTCMGTSVTGQTAELSDSLQAICRVQVLPILAKQDKHTEVLVSVPADSIGGDVQDIKIQKRKQEIRGYFSVSSYSQFSNSNVPSSQRFRYQLSLQTSHIAGSRFSTESQLSFRHKLGEWNTIRDNYFNGLKVYNLCIKYEISEKTSLTFGRKINPLISNMGAVDGLQTDFTFRNFSAGILAGSRPSFKDYSPDFSLMQVGGYVAHRYMRKTGIMQSSMALVEQTNSMKTDRRFLYFQHTNSLINQVNFFGSFELDLFRKVNEKARYNPVLSGLYASLRYAPVKKLNLYATYDARKNIIYYESYKNYISTIIDTALRQGASLQVNYRPYPFLYSGVRGGVRFQKKDPSPSRNLYGYITYAGMSRLNFSGTLSYTFLETSYLEGAIYALNLSLALLPGKCFLGAGYQYLDYRISESGLPQYQQMGSLNVNWRFARKTSLALNYELAMEGVSKGNSIQVQLRQGFR